MVTEQLLSVDEVASMLKIDPATLRRLTHNGTIRGFKFGHKIRYKQEDVYSSLKQISKPLNEMPNGK